MIPAAVWVVWALQSVVADQVSVWHLISGVTVMVHVIREGLR